MRLVVTRPLEDANILAECLTELGHVVFVEPMLTIEPLPLPEMPSGPLQAILLSSSHAARRLVTHTELHGIPVLAVGDRTADVARETGFSQVEAAEGDAISLAALVRRRLTPSKGALLYVTGRDIARDLQAELQTEGFTVERRIVYAAETSDKLSPALTAKLRDDDMDGAVLLSPRTAATWRQLAYKAGLADRLDRLTYYCLSQAVADALQHGHPSAMRVTVASRPALDSIMDAIGPA